MMEAQDLGNVPNSNDRSNFGNNLDNFGMNNQVSTQPRVLLTFSNRWIAMYRWNIFKKYSETILSIIIY